MRPELDAAGAAAPPRVNGELAFEEPWQGRLFATTMAACDAGLIDYDTFRDHLIDEIAARDASEPGDYWASWQDAFETVAVAAGLVDDHELDDRARAFAEHT